MHPFQLQTLQQDKIPSDGCVPEQRRRLCLKVQSIAKTVSVFGPVCAYLDDVCKSLGRYQARMPCRLQSAAAKRCTHTKCDPDAYRKNQHYREYKGTRAHLARSRNSKLLLFSFLALTQLLISLKALASSNQHHHNLAGCRQWKCRYWSRLLATTTTGFQWCLGSGSTEAAEYPSTKFGPILPEFISSSCFNLSTPAVGYRVPVASSFDLLEYFCRGALPGLFRPIRFVPPFPPCSSVTP